MSKIILSDCCAEPAIPDVDNEASSTLVCTKCGNPCNMIKRSVLDQYKLGKRIYSSEQGKLLKGKLVCCDEKSCDGKKCGGHNKPHVYDDDECFSECHHQGHSGFCIEVYSSKAAGK